MFKLLKVVRIALIVLIFCFFISALAGEQKEKSSSSDLNSQIQQSQYRANPLPIFPETLTTQAIPPPVIRYVPAPTESRIIQLKKGVAIVNPNIQIHPSSTTQSEMTITTHPLNSDIVLVGCNAFYVVIDTIFGSQGWYYTTDGGNNWSGSDTFATHSDTTLWMSDPAVGIDLDGNLFFNALYFTPGGPGADPRFLFVSQSTDNGSNWSELLVPNSTTGEDKNHLVVDVNAGSTFKNYLYTAFTNLRVTPWAILFSRSTDRGASFSSTPVSIGGSILGTTGGLGVNLAVGPNGEVYAAWSANNVWPPSSSTPTKLGFNKSSDGGASWQTAKSIRSVLGLPNFLNKGGNSVRVGTLPSMSVDRSSGPRTGWIYIVYVERNPTTPDVFLVRSTDGGGSWSNPIKVNQDTSGKDQWFPWISVDPITGALFVVYYDSRNFPANDSAQVYISVSVDGGETFEDLLVSDVPFLPAPIPGLATGYSGDYIGISALNGVAWPCWNDNRTGIHQAYTSKVVFIEIGQPKISALPETLDFGQVILGHPETLTVNVRNLGYPDTLEVSNISSDNSAFKSLNTTFSVPGASSQPVKVEITPTLALKDDSTGTLTIANNDTSNSNLAVPLLARLKCDWKPGDVNGDGGVNLTDIIGLVNHVFKGSPAPVPSCKGNVNGVSPLNLTDVIYLVNYVFKGGPLPVKTNVCCKN